MNKDFRQEFSIKSIPTDDTTLLENTLNAMSSTGWELYSIYEAEQNSKIVYNCIFVREVENISNEHDEELINFRTSVERMLYSKEEPYELCVNLQKKIKDKKEKIEKIKKFLESSKDEERELLNDEIKKREIETQKVPTSEFSANIMGDLEYSIYNSTSNLANTSQVLSMYENYLRLDNAGTAFCSQTGAFASTYCADGNAAILGAKVVGDMYIGLEVIANLTDGTLPDCPSYYRVNPNEEVAASGKCWGRLYLDANGLKEPNEYGQDAFVFGLNASGVVY